MIVTTETESIRKDNERITLLNARRDGYVICNLEGYPNDNNHLKCYTDLPCKIEKGRDEFANPKKWYVMFDPNVHIQDKAYSTITEATRNAIADYKKYLKDTLKLIEKGQLK